MTFLLPINFYVLQVLKRTVSLRQEYPTHNKMFLYKKYENLVLITPILRSQKFPISSVSVGHCPTVKQFYHLSLVFNAHSSLGIRRGKIVKSWC